MKKIRDYKIRPRLNILLSTILVIVFTVFGFLLINNQKNKILSDTQLRMFEQVQDLSKIIELHVQDNQHMVSSISNLVVDLFNMGGELKFHCNRTQSVMGINQVSKEKKEYTIKALEYNGDVIFQNYTFVDDIQNKTNATATIFQRIDDGFLRISTNIKKLNGERATGTYIPNSSPVIQTILKGETYRGRAFVVNDWYLTSYIPMKVNGKIEAIIYVGVYEKDLDMLSDFFLEKKYFNTGYPFLVDSNGDFLVSPKNEGENIVDTVFFAEMKNKNTNLGEIEYEWNGKEKRLYFSYVKSYDAYVAVSIYTNELLGEVKSARNFVIIALISALSLIILVTSLIMNSISKDLKNGVRIAEQVANGDLSQTMNINQEDEIGQLAKALNTMITNLKDIVSNIIQGSENIASASQQLSSTSVHLSQSANEQASSVEEMSSTLEEISANIQQNTENASQTEKVSSEANEEIKNVSSKSNQAVNANKEIANKITIINDIAFQTNLLALNAAVEAARAGAHGKGFAVVASEVRKLAEKSKFAADEIVRLATTGLKVSEAAGEVMQGIIPKVENTSKLIQEISASSMEQNSGASQVNNAIQQLNIVTQQNASASEELATSAEEMNIQAQQLKDMIDFFKVESNNGPKTNLVVKTKVKASQSLSTLSDVSKEMTELIPEEQNEHDFENF